MILLAENSWEIKSTPKKGQGVFATQSLYAGMVIGDYLGKVIRTATEYTNDKDGLYLVYYHDQASIYPTDINTPGTHLLNHSCAPNCWLYTYKGHTLVFTLRSIFPGEELTISYLLSPDPYCNPCPHICNCVSSNCTGTMHLPEERFAKWTKFSEKISKKTKKMRVSYGKELPKLLSYPEFIPDNPIYTLFGFREKIAIIRNDKEVPSIKLARKLIRDSGRIIEIPFLRTKILGVEDDKLILV